MKHKFTEAALKDLLEILREEGHISLPKDPRTILNAPGVPDFAIESNMLYLGIAYVIEETIRLLGGPPKQDVIELFFNFDGLPLSSK